MDYSSLGQLIKEACERLGWDQAQLARAVAVSQQTVSRWQAGTSRPQESVLHTLIELFDAADQADAWLVAGGYRPTPLRSDTEAPVRPLLPTLPLDRLAPKAFEEFCRDLLKYLHPDADVHGFGTQGYDQAGIDGYVRYRDGRIWTFQCKRVKQLGPAAIQTIVERTSIEGRRHFILLGRPATPSARNKIEEYPGWTLWDEEDLSRAVRNDIPRESAIRLVDTYFPGMREHFLGEPAPGPWMTADEMYRPLLSRSRTFNHTWPYVGQGDAISQLTAFADTQETSVGLLVASAGSGKSYTLLHLARMLAGRLTIRFASPAALIEPKDLEQLPTNRVLIIVDDAHDRQDVDTLVRSALYIRPHAKILLAIRPYALNRTNTNIRLATNAAPLIVRLDPLPSNDIQVLATHILQDSDMDESLARKIAEIVDGWPLAAVIGTSLVAKNQIRPEMLDHQTEFRQELLARFQNVLLGDLVEPTYQETLQDTLQLLAAVQPVTTSDEQFRALAEEIIGKPYDKIGRQIQALEGTGVLLRRGASVRITPDVLGDHVLEVASYSVDGPTGYCDRIFRAAEDEYADHLLINSGKLDWRLSQHYTFATGLLQGIWKQLRARFLNVNVPGRIEIIKRITEVAYYQPQEALDLVRLALMNDAISSTADYRQYISALPYAQRDPILDALPVALHNISYTLEYLPEACDLLWDLARTAELNNLNGNQTHPIRILSTIASYRENVSSSVYHRLLDRTLSWLNDLDAMPHQYSPFDVMDVLLDTSGTNTESTGDQLLVRQFQINVEAVRSIRARVMDAAFAELTHGDLRRALRAVKTIELGVRYPVGSFNNQPPPREVWTPEILTVLDRLRDIVSHHPLDPILIAEIRHALKWHTGHWSGKTHHAAEAVIAVMPSSIVYRVGLGLAGAEFTLFKEPGDDHDDVRSKWYSWQDNLVADLRGALEAHTLIDLVEEQLIRRNQFIGGRQSGLLLYAILSKAPDLSKIVLDRALASTDSPWRQWVRIALSAVATSQPDARPHYARRLLAQNDNTLKCGVALSFAGAPGAEEQVSAAEFELLLLLAKQGDVEVRRAVVSAVVSMLEVDRPRALQLLMSVSFSDSDVLADDVLMLLLGGADLGEPLRSTRRRRGFGWHELSIENQDWVIEQLCMTPSISEYNSEQFVALLSAEAPRNAFKILYGRVARHFESRSTNIGTYQPIPLEWGDETSLRFRETDEFEAIAREVRIHATEHVADPHELEYVAVLFKAIVGEFDSTVLSMLSEWIDSPVRAQVIATAALFSQAPRQTFWDNWRTGARLLDAAWGHGQASYNQVANDLYNALVRGPHAFILGDSTQEDIEDREHAMACAAELPTGSPAHRFFSDIARSTERKIHRQWPG